MSNSKEDRKRLMDFSKALSDEKMKHHAEIAQRVAHEVNNPLAIISGRANQLRRMLSSSKVDEEALKILSSISEIAQKTSKNIEVFSGTLNSEYGTFSEAPGAVSVAASSKDLAHASGHPSVDRSVHHSVNPPSYRPEFFHDLLNALAIAQGKTRQVMKAIDIDKDAHNREELQQRLSAAFEALKKIEKQIAEEATRLKKAA